MGKSEVEKEIKKISKSITDEQISDIILIIAKRIGIQSVDDFYNTLGFGGISLQRFMPKIKEEIEKHGLKLFGVLPQDEAVYRCDCNGEPSAKLPDNDPMKVALKGIMQSIGL
mgnify:CR=1 FL=1